MDYKAEATILKEFSKFFLDGSLYRGSKPVMWSPVEKTALAEAEIEYKNILSKSIYVPFKIIKSEDKDLIDNSLVIWTTTPINLFSFFKLSITCSSALNTCTPANIGVFSL